VLPVIVNKDFH